MKKNSDDEDYSSFYTMRFLVIGGVLVVVFLFLFIFVYRSLSSDLPRGDHHAAGVLFPVR